MSKNSQKTLEFEFERTFPALPEQVFDDWLSQNFLGSLWHSADRCEKLLLDPKVNGFFYCRFKGIPHYGRFTEIERPGRIQHTWVSPNTLGEESTVTVTFKKQGEDTMLTLVHSGIPDTDAGRGQENDWNTILGRFPDVYFVRGR